MADIGYKTAQLFDWSSVTTGYRILWATGELYADTSAIMSDFIPVQQTTYTINTQAVIIGYDDNKGYIGTYQQNGDFAKQTGWKIATFTISDSNCKFIKLLSYDTYEIIPLSSTTMFNIGSQPMPLQPYSETGWLHSLRKLTTATEAVENPLYSDGTAITAYTLKGNEEHTGTPTPSNPVMPNGVGERTENYFNVQNYVANITTHSCTVSAAANGVKITATGSDAYAGEAYKSPDRANAADRAAAIPVEEGTTYVLSADVDTFDGCYISYLDSSYDALNTSYTKIGADVPATFTTPTGTAYVALRLGSKSLGVGQSKTFANITLTKNGLYKIPISSGQQTTNIYLGSTQTVRPIYKWVLTGQENNWNTRSDAPEYRFFWIMTPESIVAQDACISSHFTLAGIGVSNTAKGFQILGSGQARFRPDGVENIDGTAWKNWLQAQYTNGTPVTVYFVLEAPETATLDEPLMKIGNYADTLSNAVSIPTTEGANSITVDTTVQPSEFTATWTGWHDASVKEKSENLFDKTGTVYQAYLTDTQWLANEDSTSVKIPCLPNTTYTISVATELPIFRIATSDNLNIQPQNAVDVVARLANVTQYTFTTSSTTQVIIFQGSKAMVNTWLAELMVNTGSTALPYEPYWK